jgi:hypothetical protein
MNSKSNSRPVSIALVVTVVASLATVIGAGTASMASEPRGGVVTSDSAFAGSFGEPLSALGGESLAEYLSDHWARMVATGV